VTGYLRALFLATAVAFAITAMSASPAALPATVDAASCVRIIGGVFNSPSNDNFMPYLNGEYVVIRNSCSTYRVMTGFRVTDYGTKHTYYFPTGYRIYPGYNVKLHSGLGTNTRYHLYWKRGYGAVWNNTPPERAYLRNRYGTVVSSWSLY
jgi:lamin tail-like protein